MLSFWAKFIASPTRLTTNRQGRAGRLLRIIRVLSESMIQVSTATSANSESNFVAATNWNELAERVLAGYAISEAEALSIVRAPDEQLLDILSAAYRIRHKHFGKTVQLHYLMSRQKWLMPGGLQLLLAVEGFRSGDPQIQLPQPR